MEAMNALTPNTAAFLESLTSSISQPETGGFPPSAFFPVPGRDTPVDSSPSSIGDKVKPIVSDDSDHDSPVNNHKRKANKTEEDHDEDDDDDDESDGGHEDKRHEPNKGNGRRKSNDKAKGGAAPKDNLTKAQRRKEQNRAAQKAFRERREAKVRDVSHLAHNDYPPRKPLTLDSSRRRLQSLKQSRTVPRLRMRTSVESFAGYRRRTWPSSRLISPSRCLSVAPPRMPLGSSNSSNHQLLVHQHQHPPRRSTGQALQTSRPSRRSPSHLPRRRV
jgi:hypothetical protein